MESTTEHTIYLLQVLNDLQQQSKHRYLFTQFENQALLLSKYLFELGLSLTEVWKHLVVSVCGLLILCKCVQKLRIM